MIESVNFLEQSKDLSKRSLQQSSNTNHKYTYITHKYACIYTKTKTKFLTTDHPKKKKFRNKILRRGDLPEDPSMDAMYTFDVVMVQGRPQVE